MVIIHNRRLPLFMSIVFILFNEGGLLSQNAKLNIYKSSITVKEGTSLYTSGTRLYMGGHFNNSGNLLVTGDWLNYATPRELVCVGEAGTVLISVDGGTTWKYDTAQSQVDLSKVAYPVQAPMAPGADVIYAAGQNGTILKSTDYGKTWVPLSQQTTSDLQAISMVDAQTGVAVGDAGEIMKTADGGLTWQSVLSPVSSDLKDVTFIDALTGFIVCGGGAIFGTVDGGATWVVQATAPHGLNAIRFSRDALAGYAVGQSGTILQSFDRGVTWDQLATPAQYELKAVEAFNAKEAVAVGESGTLLKTFDGGLIWTLQQVSAGTLNDITAINNYQAIIVGDNGEMYKMCNIMNTCTQLSSATNRRLESVSTRNILAVDGTVKFIGKTTKQIIGGNTITIFKDLVVNNHSTGINVQVPITVKNSFLLSRGIIYTTEKTPLSILDNVVVTGGHDAAFIEGPVIKFGDDAFTFPLGAGNYYHPLAMTSPPSKTDVMMAQYFHTKQYLGDSLEPSLESISDCEYWSTRWLNGGGSVDAWLGWNQNSCGIDTDITNLAVAMWNLSYWKSLGNGGITGSVQAGMLKTLMPPWPVPVDPGNLIYITIGKKPPYLKIPTYAVFKKKLDGGYYLVKNNKLHFTYEGEYNNGTLYYKIYDYKRAEVTTSCSLQRQYGDNRYTLDFSLCSTSLPSGYYTLEVTSEKNEIFLLKFKY